MSRYNTLLAGRKRPRVFFSDDEGKTRQEFAEESDVNRIVARFQSGQIIPTADPSLRYLDCHEVPDFHTAANLIAEARSAYESAPEAFRRTISFEEWVASGLQEKAAPEPSEAVSEDLVPNEASEGESSAEGDA